MVVVLIIMTLGVVYAGYGVYQQLSGRMRAAQSVERITQSVWQLTYEGDYYFNEYLAKGGAKSDSLVGEFLAPYLGKKARRIGHQTLALRTKAYPALLDGEALVGANGELSNTVSRVGSATPRLMLVLTRPDSGYASISTVYLDYLQLEQNYDPTRGFMDKMLVLTTIYFPTDGLNDQGLSVVDLPMDSVVCEWKGTGRPDLTTYTAVRLLLDRCSNVAEARMLLRRFDVFPSGGVAHRLFLRDQEGQTALFSWDSDGLLQVKSEAGSLRRLYEKEALRDLLNLQGKDGQTQWSVRYDLQQGMATWWFRHQYDRYYQLSLSPNFKVK